MRQPMSVEAQLAPTLHFLSDDRRMRKTANAFGCGLSIAQTRKLIYTMDELSRQNGQPRHTIHCRTVIVAMTSPLKQ